MRVLDLVSQYPVAALAAAGVIVASAGVAVFWLARRRLTPAEIEKRRRLRVNQFGRTIEATIVEADASNLYYTYDVQGIEYSAAQDVSALVGLIGGDPARLVGSVSVKYLRENPANSIVLCEEWSGLPARAMALQAQQAGK